MAKKVVENFHAYTSILSNASSDETDEQNKSGVPSDHFNIYKEL